MQNQIESDYRIKLLESIKSGTNPFITMQDAGNVCVVPGSDSNGSTSENVYENLKHFISHQDESHVKDYYNPENIYENICHDCGRIYDDICGFCNDDEPFSESYRNGKNIHFIKRLFKKHFKSPSLKRSNSKIRKSDIYLVHDVGDTVFKTNCTFDINEMSRMRNDVLRNTGSDESTSDYKEESVDKEDRIYENLPFHVDASVSCWIESIRACIEEYGNDVQYNVKTIPSKTFGESEWSHNTLIKYENEQTEESLTQSNVEIVKRFIDTYKEINSRAKDQSNNQQNTDGTKTVKISWSDTHDRTSLEISRDLRYQERQSNEVTSLESYHLLDNEDNLTTTIPHKTRHQDKYTFLSAISKATCIDNNSLRSFNRLLVLQTQAYTYLNKLLLSISLNTITLSYDICLKKISVHYRLLITRKNDGYFCGTRANTPFELISHQNSLNRKPKRINNKILSKNESFLNLLPASHVRNTRQEQYLQHQSLISRALNSNTNTTNMDSKAKNTEVNNDIYYFIWNCDSASETTRVKNTDESVQKNLSTGVTQDDQNWVSAHEDFTSAADLMDVVDENPRFLTDDKIKETKESDSRSYSNVVILYNDVDPLNNKIIYRQTYNHVSVDNTSDRQNDTHEKVRFSASEKTFDDSDSIVKKKYLDINSLQDSVKEFLNTIRVTEDEDELVRLL